MRPLNDYFENLLSFAACLATVDGERQRVGKGRGLEGWRVGGLATPLHFQTSNLLKKRSRGFKDSRGQVETDRRLED